MSQNLITFWKRISTNLSFINANDEIERRNQERTKNVSVESSETVQAYVFIPS